MIEKLNENASLSQLITAFENSTNEIKTISNTLKEKNKITSIEYKEIVGEDYIV
ncbi:XkdX family protein [Clostridioides difficile]|uniref:XkdX family protein n=1 Tax=Clostridioides difficile TaxID=1496 RepID=UPI001184BFA4|nr:XkdX family protein [Clostridioides difficile]